jgi:hypothetical protein
MLARKQQQAKKLLKAKGWSYRRAAPVLGVHYVHLALVLNGKRQSARLLTAIEEMRTREEGDA